MKKLSKFLILFNLSLLLISNNIYAESFRLMDAATRAQKVNKGIAVSQKKLDSKEKAVSSAIGRYFPNVVLDFSYIHLNDEVGISLNPIKDAIVELQARDQVSLLNLQSLISTGTPLSAEMQQLVQQQAKIKLNEALPDFYAKLKPQSYPMLTLTVTQPIFTGLKIPNAVTAAKSQRDMEVVSQQQTIAQTNIEVIDYYLNLLLAKENLKVRQEVYDGILKHKNRAETLLETGVIQMNQKLRADVSLAEAEKNLFEAGELLNIAKIALASVIETKADDLKASDTLIYINLDKDLSSFLSTLKTKNLNLQQISSAKKALEAKANISFADYLPTIGAFGTYQFIDKGLSVLDPKWAIGAKASWTVFNGLQRSNNYQSAKLEAEAMDDMQDEATRKLELLVRKQYLQMQVSEKSYRMLEASLEQAKENELIANKRFETGVGTSFDVIDAELQLEGIKLNRLKELKEYYKNMADLYNTINSLDEFINFWTANQIY